MEYNSVIKKKRTNLIVAFFMMAKKWKKNKFPLIDDWIKKMWYIYTTEYYSTIRKNEILPFATTWVDFENITLSENNSDRKSQELYDLTHVWDIKLKATNKQTRQQTDTDSWKQ